MNLHKKFIEIKSIFFVKKSRNKKRDSCTLHVLVQRLEDKDIQLVS